MRRSPFRLLIVPGKRKGSRGCLGSLAEVWRGGCQNQHRPNLFSGEELYAGREMQTEWTDIELMLRAQNGDAAAFHELVRRYREPLRRFFAAMLADRSQADDFVQETFLRLWLARSRYEPTGKFSTYLFQIGKHYWLNQRKKLRPEVDFEHVDDALYGSALTISQPEAVMLQRYRDGRIRRAIATLPEHYRA